MATRPTLDRVKESLFSILQPRLAGALVLDLFAGSGALGLEALSRGAQSAVFVDHARAAQLAILENIAATGMQACARLLCGDWQACLRTLAREGAAFDLIFLDPPYGMEGMDALFDALREGGILRADGLAVHEHAAGIEPVRAGWTAADSRRYGDTEITFYTLTGRGGTDAEGTVPGQL